jgi:hypothetical protein
VTRREAPTVDQLLNLADRAEDGPLSPAEAGRLRAGIRNLVAEREAAEAERRLIAKRHHQAALKDRQASKHLATVRALVTSARRRGARAIPTHALAAAIDVKAETQRASA